MSDSSPKAAAPHVPGDGAYEWQGFLPNSALPHQFNPAEQFIATANHKMIPDDFAFPVGFEWAAPTRFQRIHDVLTEAKSTGHKLTLGDMGSLQSDVVSLMARKLQPMLHAALDAQGNAVPATTRTAADMLLEWDGALREDSAPAVLYELWTQELSKAIVDRVIPPPARAVVPPWPTPWVLGRPAPGLFPSCPGCHACGRRLVRPWPLSPLRRWRCRPGHDTRPQDVRPDCRRELSRDIRPRRLGSLPGGQRARPEWAARQPALR
jgi:hypothetical protein